jgi:manganese efflux pump family protein
MSFFELFVLALGLSMDCLAVSITIGTSQKPGWQHILKMAFFFGLFQGIMPLIGWFIGNSFKHLIQSFDHWIAFGILAFIGIRMIIESSRLPKEKKSFHIGKMSLLLGLAVATSIDALATGIGFGIIRVNIIQAAIIITCVTFLVTLTGARIGIRSKIIPASWAELSGGVVLLLIGLKILFNHLGIL